MAILLGILTQHFQLPTHIATKHQGQLQPPGQTTRACYPCSCSFSSGPWCPCWTDAVLSLRPSWSRRRRRGYHKSTNIDQPWTETHWNYAGNSVWLCLINVRSWKFFRGHLRKCWNFTANCEIEDLGSCGGSNECNAQHDVKCKNM